MSTPDGHDHYLQEESLSAPRSSMRPHQSSSSIGSVAVQSERPIPAELPAVSRDNYWDITFSFSCGGWFQMYFFGAAHALIDTGLLQQWEAEGRRIRFAGASAGSLAAACLASGMHDFESVREYVAECAVDFRSSWRNLFRMRDYLLNSLERFGGNLKKIDTDALMREKLSNGSLEIAITILPKMKPRLVSEFPSYERVREAILASCCMVPLVGTPFKLKETGEWVTDGGLSNFTPRMNDENVISVSAMYFQDASVRPRTFVPSWWGVFPPDDTKYRNLFWMGYNDMVDTLVSYELLDRELGEYVLKPETDFSIHDSYLDVFFTFVMEILMLLILRPVVILCVYAEFLMSIAFYMAKTVLFFDRQSARRLYDTLRNTTSLRTLVRLVFGKKVPVNEERLSHSWLYRMFEPLALGGTRKTGRECWSMSGSPVGKQPSLSPVGRLPRSTQSPLGPRATASFFAAPPAKSPPTVTTE